MVHFIDTSTDTIRYALGVGTEHERFFELPKNTLGSAYDEHFGLLFTIRQIIARGPRTPGEQQAIRMTIPELIEAVALVWAFAADETSMLRARLGEAEQKLAEFEKSMKALKDFEPTMQRIEQFMTDIGAFEKMADDLRVRLQLPVEVVDPPAQPEPEPEAT